MSGHTNSKLTVSLFSGANKASANVLENPDLTGFEIQSGALVIYTLVSLLVIDTVPGFAARFSGWVSVKLLCQPFRLYETLSCRYYSAIVVRNLGGNWPICNRLHRCRCNTQKGTPCQTYPGLKPASFTRSFL